MGREKTRQRLAIRKAFAPKKKKTLDNAHKQHKWESFSYRVSRLRIDPIRRDRGRHDDGNLEALESHFHVSLDKWRDLNLSEDFVKFARQVEGLCDNLPQVLHHQDRIVDVLLTCVETSTAVSAEPFLDLVAQLAQDLQNQFADAHFERVVTTVAGVAARHQEVEVVEWCFNCLTWLFKYLERILSADICALYDLLAPYLGKERQKPFVSRFAAESLSFLVKRVAKRKEAATAFVRHALRDLEEMAMGQEVEEGSGGGSSVGSGRQDTELYEHSLTALFLEAIKSVKESLHSTGPTLFTALVEETLAIQQDENATDASPRVIREVFHQLLHHTHATNLEPLLDSINTATPSSSDALNEPRIILTSQLLLLSVSVKVGHRIANWSNLFQHLEAQVDVLTSAGPSIHKRAATELLVVLAAAHRRAPLDAALASLGMLDKVCCTAWQEFFPGFCNLYAENAADRFKSFLLPRLQKFLTHKWDGQTRPLSILIPRLVSNGAVTPRTLKLPSGFESEICSSFLRLEVESSSTSSRLDAAHYKGLLSLLGAAGVSPSSTEQVGQALLRALETFVPATHLIDLRSFVLGDGFLFVGENPVDFKDDRHLIRVLRSLSEVLKDLGQFPAFFQALAAFLKKRSDIVQSLPPASLDPFKEVLLQCVSSSSHDLRLAALQILQIMIPNVDLAIQSELSDAIDIESTEPTIESMRYISMKIKNIGMHYASYSSTSSILAQAIPRWLFGMLHVKLAQTWEDVCAAFKDISTTKEGEEAICDVAFQWLSDAPLRDQPTTERRASNDEGAVPDDYFSQLRGKAMDSLLFVERTDEILEKQFEERHQRVAALTPVNRVQALRVLKAVPALAEKKSRSLVPVLLSWSGDAGIEDPAPAGIEALQEEEEANRGMENFDTLTAKVSIPREEELRWPRKDQKALLGLFAAFGNPKVLSKSEEVYDTLLGLLAHGDAEIQKSALQAVLAWKDKTLKKHAEELYKFLDDARLREQLSIFLDSSANNDSAENSTALPAQDREVVMPIVLRLVYGRIIARSRDGRGGNRKAVFVILSKFGVEEMNVFLDVMLAPMEAKDVPLKRQVGMLNMIKDLLETWKSTAASFISRLAPAVLSCLLGTQQEESTNLTRASKTLGMQCLNLCFEAADERFEWAEYMPALFVRIITPRLDKFAEENAQGVSALMRMFGIWARDPSLAQWLWKQEETLLVKVVACIELDFAKEVLKRFVLDDVLKPLIAQAAGGGNVQGVVRHYAQLILEAIAKLVTQPISKELIEDAVATITVLKPYTNSCPPSLLSAAARLVQQPTKKVPHHTKVELLGITSHFFPSILADSQTHKDVFSAICASFAYFSDGASRSLLVEIAQKFAQKDGDLDEVIQLLDGINAFVPGRLDLPDFDRRSAAFGVVTEDKWRHFSSRQWRLLLGNLLFYIKDTEELAVRASASHALRRFVEASKEKGGGEKEEMMQMLTALLASLEAGLKDSVELVQIEYLSVLAEIARLPEERNPVYDLHHLLMSGDEEANLFNNLLHVQQHRRVRAMNRLINVAAEGVLASRCLYRFLIPLLEGFIFKSSDGVLMAEAMKALGHLVEWLDWQQFRVLVRRYVEWVKRKEDKQETVLKLLDGVTSGLGRSAVIRAEIRKKTSDEVEEGMDLDEQNQEVDVELPANAVQTKLSKTMPGPEKLSTYITEEVLPPLSVFLRQKDESFVSRRISCALIAAKYVHLLPEMDFQIRFPPLLTDVCNILRSKDQGSRDMTRRALSSMCALIGASAFGYIVKELRSALQQGFYLHVLAFSVHSILEQTISKFAPGELDYCLSDVVDVIVEDVFGNTGKEKDITEYKADKNTKKEVKGKKSFDTMQLLASATSLGHLAELVRPLQGLLAGYLSIKEVRYVDELLRRVELGVLQNESLKNRDILRFCYEIVQEAHANAPPAQKRPDRKSSAGLVESAFLKPAAKKASQTSLHKNQASGKIIRFALEMVRSMLKKNKDLLTASNISGFMPVIGDALLDPNEDVKLAAMRLFTGIVNVPLKRVDEDAPVYIAEAARIVEDSQSHSGELEQAALKLISAVLRERKSTPVKVRAQTISVLLKRMKGDLQVISQQGAAFNLLRSILGRQIVVPELYEIMDGDDGVAAISVRDHDHTTRDLARSVYFQFLMDCPQGKGRWGKQLAFLRGNLEYEYAEGRRSVMDTIYLLLSKVGDDVIIDVIKEMFWPLVSVMVNDADADCREMAARLVKQVFERADEEWLKTFVDLASKLLKQGNAVQKRTALQGWRLYLEVQCEEAKGVQFVLERIRGFLDPKEFEPEEWQLAYWALHTFSSIIQTTEEDGYGGSAKAIWIDAKRYLNYPHLWVKQEVATLFGMLFACMAKGNKLDDLPLTGPGKVTLKASEICELTSRHLRLLQDGVTKELASLVVRNLAFFGRVFAASGMEWQAQSSNGTLAVQEPDHDDDDEFKGLSDDDADDRDEDEADVSAEKQTSLNYLLFQLGSIIRRELGKAITPGPRSDNALIPKTAALQLLTALCNTLPNETLQQSAATILSPLIHLTSPERSITAHSTTDFKTAHEQLISNATELQDTLREKLGTTIFVKVLQQVQAAARERREERRAKRKVEAVTRPEVGARKKAKRIEREKERKREKNEFHRGKRRGW